MSRAPDCDGDCCAPDTACTTRDAKVRGDYEGIDMSGGGPAFPGKVFSHYEVTATYRGQPVSKQAIYTETPGMSLRDYFAAQALTGICSNDWALNNKTTNDCADWAYQMADSMLVERAK